MLVNILFIMDCYGRGFMISGSAAGEDMGDYNTLRVMFLAYFDTVADDVMSLSAKQWNDINSKSKPAHHIRKSLRYTVQNHCGVCLAANEPATSEASRKRPADWVEKDYACRKENFDFRKYTMIMRQHIEADHNIAESNGKKNKIVSDFKNIFRMFDEMFHAPYHCYFCHKRRTANQAKKDSWTTNDRDYRND